MSSLLMWIEASVCGIAWSAMLLVARRTTSGHWVRRGLLVAGVGLPLAAWGLAAGAAWYLHRAFGLAGGLAEPCLTGFVVQLLAQLAMGTEGRGWPATTRAAFAWAMSGLLLVMTLWNADLAVRQRMAVLRTEAGAAILSVAPPRPADRDNAATLYEQAAEALVEATTDEDAAWFAWTDTAKELAFDAKLAASHLEANAVALALVRRAARLPGCDFGHSVAQLGPQMLLPELTNLRRLARLLALAARAHAQAGEGDLALADTDAIISLAAHTTGGPSLIHGLVGIACERIALRTLAGVAFDVSKGPVAWRLPALELAPMTCRQQIRRSLHGEQAFGLAAFANLVTVDDFDVFALAVDGRSYLDGIVRAVAGPGAVVWRVFFLEEDLASYRVGLAEMIERTSLSPADTPAPVPTPNGVLTRMLMPALSKVLGTARRFDAERALARAALRCLRHRGEAGAFPATLADLDGPTPLDPFDRKPLRMRVVSDHELAIYSVGPDGKDDEGRPVEEGNSDATGDLVFTLVVPAR